MSKKEITNADIVKSIEDLAQATNKGFSDMDKRFDRVEGRLDDLELKMTNVAYRFELNELQFRVEKLEKKLKSGSRKPVRKK